MLRIKNRCILNLLFVSIMSATACISCTNEKRTSNVRSSADTASVDIPIVNGRPIEAYVSVHSRARKLMLDSIENGYDSLQVRIWYDYALSDTFQLLILKKTGLNWAAILYSVNYSINSPSNIAEIGRIISKNLSPKSGWANFSNYLLKSDILTLPDMEQIPEYNVAAGSDGMSYNLEVATHNKYRFYGYWMPEMFPQYKEARSISEIIRFLESEFDYKKLKGYTNIDTGNHQD